MWIPTLVLIWRTGDVYSLSNLIPCDVDSRPSTLFLDPIDPNFWQLWSGGTWITIAAGVEKGGFRDVACWRERLCEVGNDGSVLAYRVDLRTRVAAMLELREKDGDRDSKHTCPG
jgi:hypothetical protein